jgi:hypothetical protein
MTDNVSAAHTEGAILEQLGLVSHVVETAAATLATGHFVDMTGLDIAVAELCTAAGALPRPYRHRAAQKLSRLALDLSALAEALALQCADSERAAAAEARQRAASAYPADSAR